MIGRDPGDECDGKECGCRDDESFDYVECPECWGLGIDWVEDDDCDRCAGIGYVVKQETKP